MIPKFKVIMMTHNRLGLLDRTIKSLNKSILRPDHLYVFDDGSDNREKVTEVLNQSVIPFTMQMLEKSNCSKRTRNSISWMFENFEGLEGVVNLNSDMVFNPDWFSVLLERYDTLADRDQFLGAVSVYNYKGHKAIQSINLNAEGTVRAMRKQSIGIFGCLVTRMFWKDCILPIQKESGWEYTMSKLAKSKNWNMYCTMPSYVQHTGTKDGVHAHKSVTARDFLGE